MRWITFVVWLGGFVASYVLMLQDPHFRNKMIKNTQMSLTTVGNLPGPQRSNTAADANALKHINTAGVGARCWHLAAARQHYTEIKRLFCTVKAESADSQPGNAARSQQQVRTPWLLSVLVRLRQRRFMHHLLASRLNDNKGKHFHEWCVGKTRCDCPR